MLKSKTDYANICSREKTHTKNTQKEIPGMICVSSAYEKFLTKRKGVNIV